MQTEINFTPAARCSDPQTSKQASARVRRTAGVDDAVARVSQCPGATSGELMQQVIDQGGSLIKATGVGKRISDAVKHGLIVPVGVRKCRESGYSAQTWRVSR
tara:strand:- start:330 stop:638 length:309 start_codon:yes stop_codon:yes gene_type:complete